MDVKHNSQKEMIERSLNATEKAIESIREGELVRRHTDLELRDMQISMNEDFDRIRGMMHELDEQIHKDRSGNSKWMNQKMEKAKATADQALASTLMVKDVQLLEKKVNILKESVVQVNKSFYKYEKDVDMNDLMDQVIDMVHRTEKKEQDALEAHATDEQAIGKAFRGAIEGLYGLKSSNSKVMEEAKLLAGEMRVFRDAASNKNFHTMISRIASNTATSGVPLKYSSGPESSFSTSAYTSFSKSANNSSMSGSN
ncbi:Methyl-accepting chemotaxis protein [Caenorhabditis elegans]|uniref:Methyl-accepting chemotaxis protein n=1 Tax=Caenorhabditis elegans TaxID=6239 RepID=Q18848_CAEEL|nr:Methyl-accepting chemotaxis protein [Caenorhabditis elegans]CAA99816.2 Methyl-accepting chemotaxis protein [Caenorhabditis elegans]|eukprot:NP_492202.2 Uncharacterized protein CELE_C54G4.3 [Caenorhabditis elegans]